MITRTTKIKLIVFVIVAILGVGYATWRYAGGDRVIGNTTYTVPMKLGDTSGIFTNAEVTYRGVKVGRVGEVRLTKTGLDVDLVVDRSAPPIPAEVTGTIADRSAVGEQYVDLKPKQGVSSTGRTLENEPEDKRTIAAADTSAPLPTQDLINDVNGLSTSVPLDSLRTVVDEAYTAFGGTGPDLQRLLDDSQKFISTAQDNLPATQQLLDTSRTVLGTQIKEGSNLKQFAGDLRGVSASLKGSDADIRSLIDKTPPAAQQVNGLVNDNAQNFPKLLPQLWTTSEVLRTRNKGLEQTFVVYPMLAGAGDTILDANGNANLGFALNLMNPAPCVRGYESTKKRPAADTNPLPQNKQAYCAEPSGSPINVRGSVNAPYAGKPVEVKPVQAQQQPKDSPAGLLGITPLGPGPQDLPKALDLD
ncbi:MCE family protein [Sciscionella marina]|uniref:MCE family protein n=1 Tax=Sciscionella marina TaxID=508770 RepID=UPI00038275D0|nr:MlaD family protein [Sciscionella marina]